MSTESSPSTIRLRCGRSAASQAVLVAALLMAACVGDSSDEPAFANPYLSWFPIEPESLVLAPGDSALVTLAARDSSGDTLAYGALPVGHLAHEQRYPPIVTIRKGENDTIVAVFRVHVRADTLGADTLRFAWFTTECVQRFGRVTVLGPRLCYPVAWFRPLEVPVLIR